MGAAPQRAALKAASEVERWEEMLVTAWLDDECGEGWFPEGCELVPNFTSLIVSAAVAIVAALVVVVRPTRRSLASIASADAALGRAEQSGRTARDMRRTGSLHVTCVGSVARNVLMHAKASVLIVRETVGVRPALAARVRPRTADATPPTDGVLVR